MLVLTCAHAGKRAHKIVTPETIYDYDAGGLFTGAEAPVYSFEQMVTVLEALRHERASFVVRGALRPDAPPVFRRKYKEEGSPIVPRPRAWVMIDADTTGIPCDPTCPEAAIAEYLATLPPDLAGGNVYWHLTTKCAPANLRAHVWLYLDREYDDAAVKRALPRPKYDTSIYQPVGVHYTSDPVFANGAIDPYPRRSGVILRGGVSSLSLSETAIARGEAESMLAKAIAKVANAPEGARHDTLNRWAYRLGAYAAYLPPERVTRELAQAALASGVPADRAQDEAMRAVLDGTRKPVSSWKASLDTTEGGAIRDSDVNIATVLANDPRVNECLAYDLFAGVARWQEAPEAALSTVRAGDELTDDHGIAIAEWLYVNHRLRTTALKAFAGAVAAARLRPYHPIRDWLEGLEWDGVRRLDTWLSWYLGAEDTEYTRDVARKWLIMAVARVYDPGVQADTLLVLEGGQGFGKTSALRALAGQWYGSIGGQKVTDKDTLLKLRGRWILEFAELDSLNRSELHAVKDFITTTVDRYREPYGRTVRDYPRQCVFSGSTNEKEYLTDPTGGRRFLPVKIHGVIPRKDGKPGLETDSLALTRDRAVLWAEAREAYQRGEEFIRIAGAEKQQQERTAPDPWIDELTYRLREVREITAREALTIHLQIPTDRVNHGHSIRLARCMHAIGWTSTRVQGARGYVNPAPVATAPASAQSAPPSGPNAIVYPFPKVGTW